MFHRPRVGAGCRTGRGCAVSDDGECTVCEGGGGWWVACGGYGDPYAETCQHCDGTGIEPDPAVQRTLDVEEYL